MLGNASPLGRDCRSLHDVVSVLGVDLAVRWGNSKCPEDKVANFAGPANPP